MFILTLTAASVPTSTGVHDSKFHSTSLQGQSSTTASHAPWGTIVLQELTALLQSACHALLAPSVPNLARVVAFPVGTLLSVLLVTVTHSYLPQVGNCPCVQIQGPSIPSLLGPAALRVSWVGLWRKTSLLRIVVYN